MDTGLGTGDGCELPATAIYWLTDDPQPGLVLVEFADAYGRPHQLVGKTAYFDGDLQSTTDYPCPTSTQCTIEEVNDGVATVSTWWLEGGPDNTRFVFDVWLDILKPTTDI
ncbi:MULTISPECIES: hypothetical protein [Streptomyces]|uniref:Uncharacterized protein n=1 Tax=Streptomyces tauricus TaxID=68274 RepID=A0ABZ1J995_9ACTN|nr:MULTISPECIES: hypothetical protein [Streptomyces]UPZ26599.1 hypothetical protein MUK60_01495 [Streptomyces sp. LRE541]